MSIQRVYQHRAEIVNFYCNGECIIPVMSLEKLVETVIQEAQERGEFDNLKGKGKPLDLTAYFETPEELRLALSTLKNANFVPAEVELLQEIAALKEKFAEAAGADERNRIGKLIRNKQLQFDIMMDRLKRKT